MALQQVKVANKFVVTSEDNLQLIARYKQEQLSANNMILKALKMKRLNSGEANGEDFDEQAYKDYLEGQGEDN